MANREARGRAIREAAEMVRNDRTGFLRRAGDPPPTSEVASSERTEYEREIKRLRNAIGDVRGMQSDGATPEQMDHVLALALEGLPARSAFDEKDVPR